MNYSLLNIHPRRAATLGLLCGGVALAVTAVVINAQSAKQPIQTTKQAVTVYKTPTCGCCSKWVEHMKSKGFEVQAINMDDVEPIKRANGVPRNMESCHTALVGGYVVEGHVPADMVQRMLREKPAIAGIAAPGMPVGSPGMEVPNVKAEPYSVMAFDKAGKTTLYEKR
jgi:hypothetical protein